MRYVAAMILFGAPLFSQRPAAPAFEVTSVKAVEDGKTWAVRKVDAQLYRSVSNVMQAVMWAWKVKDYQVLGAPSWLGQERFEISATISTSAGNPASDDEVRVMMRGLLRDRFRLKMHRETREMDVYALVAGKSGPKLVESALGSPAEGRGVNIVSGTMIARDATMPELVDVLTTNLDRPVIDKTNLTAHYDFDLTWDQPGVSAAGSSGWAPIGPAIFTPIQSLGLRLEAQKALVEMLIIDSVSRPSAN
jgi:uncharacterized protein (TIGR03435 family)